MTAHIRRGSQSRARSAFRILLIVAAVAVGAHCAGTVIGPGRGFEINYPDNRPSDVGRIAQEIASRPRPAVTPMVVVAPQRPARGLTAFALPDGRRLWQTGIQADARPVVLGDLVLTHGSSQIIGFDAAGGRERFRMHDHGYSLIGAARDGDRVAVTLGPGQLSRREGIFYILDARSGGVQTERSVEQALGSPGAAGGYAFVPWNGQYLSVIDMARGEEVTRIRSTDDVFSRAISSENAVYFGARHLYRFAAESGRGTRQGAPNYALPRDDLPGNPSLMIDGYISCICGINARERVGVVFRPDPSAPGVTMVDGLVYVLFHRVVFALSAADGNVRWAHVHDSDIAGSEVVRGGLVVVDERGTISLVNAQRGNITWQQALGNEVSQAVLQLPLDFAPGANHEDPAQPPVTSLLAAAGGTDNRMLPARVFAVRALGSIQGADATRALLEVASRANNVQELRAAAGEALARRTEGTDALLEALNTHYDFIRQTRTPPVGFIARSLAAARDRRGVAPLIAHLQDPETPAAELPPLVTALRELADSSAVPALMDFLRLYHADDGMVPPVGGGDAINDRQGDEQEAINAALEQAIQAVVRLGGPPERRWLDAMLADRNTLEPVRNAIQRALQPAGEAGSGGSSSGSGASADADAGASSSSGNGAEADPNVPPTRLSADMIRDAFQAVQPDLMHCLAGVPSRPGQLRVQFRYDSAGVITNVTVTPPAFQPCIAPIAARVHLPASQVSREIGTYYVIGGTQ